MTEYVRRCRRCRAVLGWYGNRAWCGNCNWPWKPYINWRVCDVEPAMEADLPCGCYVGQPEDRYCPYHEGRDDERDMIVRYLVRIGQEGLAEQIEFGWHVPDPPARIDGPDA